MRKVAVTFDNSDVLEVEDIDILKFNSDAFKIIEGEGDIVARIIISEEVWAVFRKKCGMDFLEETANGNFIWGATIEVIPNCPRIMFLSGDYIMPAEEIIKSGVINV